MNNINNHCKICGKETKNNKVTCGYDCLILLRSINVKGIKNPMYGKESWCKGLTKETDKRLKIISNKNSISHKGKISPRKGIKLLQETKEKVSKNHADMSGSNNPNYGKHWTDEQKRMIGDGNKGKVVSEESKQKIRISTSGSKNKNFGKPAPNGAGYGKRMYYNSPFQGIICLRSTYEYKYALYLDRNNIPWLYEPKAFLMIININGKEKETTYRPDFLLLKERKFIETKGYLTKESELKINKFQSQYPNLKLEILYKQDLQNLGIKV